jgi:uncharacterized iron-regulated membrane protein
VLPGLRLHVLRFGRHAVPAGAASGTAVAVMGALVGLGLFVLLVVGVVKLRRRRQRFLSGTVAARPVFSVEPPARRVHKLGGERL